ncbi:MAG: hypothetical protein V3T86_06660 [Planctomycetota bacterium]
MNQQTRREFLGDVGRSMLVAGIGGTLVSELGLMPALAGDNTLSFGRFEPLARLMQETPPDKLQRLLVEKLSAGTSLRDLIAAGALANARTFGGQDYVGYHAAMALMPAYQIAQEMPTKSRALPVLKVLYRNTARIQARGGRRNEVLHTVGPAPEAAPLALRSAIRRRDMDGAERLFAKLAQRTPKDAFNDLQQIVQDDINVHRIVLAWRAWDLLRLTGEEHAHTMLRQSVRFCVHEERERVSKRRPEPRIRTVLPKLLDEYGLLGRKLGDRKADDKWVAALGSTVFSGTREQAAEAVAAALADGFAPDAIGEAMSLAANQLVLHDGGRREDGTVHGASVGVHASDAANAWRHTVRVASHSHAVASLVVGAFHTAGQSGHVGREPFIDAPEPVEGKTPELLLREARAAVEERDQAWACVAVQRYGQLGAPAAPVFELLRRYAVSEDGKLHAEKYYRTVTEEFASTRAAFRWRHLVALARVTASEYGTPAPGHADARRLLELG